MATITVTTTVLAEQAGIHVHGAVTGTPVITSVTIGRQDPSGFQQLLRYGEAVPVVAGVVDIDDFEAPLDVPVTYVIAQAVPAGSTVGTSAPVTVPSFGQTWLKDPAYPTRNMVVPVVTSVTGFTRAARAGVFPILGRANPVAVTSVRGGPEGVITLHTLTDDERRRMEDLLSTGSILLAQGPASEFGSHYLFIGDVGEERIGLVMEPSRVWTLPFVEVDRPAGLVHASTTDRSWRAVRTTYATWGDVIATGKTNQDILDNGP